MNHGRFYTLTSATHNADELLFTRIGANDPDFNLRRDPGFMIRRRDADNTVFASVIEAHGGYSPVSELAVNSNSSVAALEVIFDDADYTAVSITDVQGDISLFVVAHTDAAASSKHRLDMGG